MTLPPRVTIVDVGPRDGLQNEPRVLPVDTRIELVRALTDAGVSVVEIGAFVSEKWVPQMAGSDAVLRGIERRANVRYPVLTPNLQGLEAALAAGATEIAVFGAASESFSRKNINCSIDESINRFQAIVDEAHRAGIRVRGYVSCVLGCPYEGHVPIRNVAGLAARLADMGCHEISLGDTIGVGTPNQVQAMLSAVTEKVPMERLAVHFHDTYGQALANIHIALEMGVTTIDSSVAGLGGCPYAKGAAGNVASEEVVYLLNGLGIETGIDLDQLVAAGQKICTELGRKPASRVSSAIAAIA